jgi:transposase
VVEDVIDEEQRILVLTRTPSGPAACPGCGAGSVRVHGYHRRTVADVPLDGRPVTVEVRVRRLVCLTPDCCNTFVNRCPVSWNVTSAAPRV